MGKFTSKTELGNTAFSYWDVTLNFNDIIINNTKKSFKFKNAAFKFDVNLGISYGDEHHLFTKIISVSGTYFETNNKTIQLQTLILD